MTHLQRTTLLVQGQLLIAADLGYLDDGSPIIVLADRLGRRFTCFIRRLGNE